MNKEVKFQKSGTLGGVYQASPHESDEASWQAWYGLCTSTHSYWLAVVGMCQSSLSNLPSTRAAKVPRYPLPAYLPTYLGHCRFRRFLPSFCCT